VTPEVGAVSGPRGAEPHGRYGPAGGGPGEAENPRVRMAVAGAAAGRTEGGCGGIRGFPPYPPGRRAAYRSSAAEPAGNPRAVPGAPRDGGRAAAATGPAGRPGADGAPAGPPSHVRPPDPPNCIPDALFPLSPRPNGAGSAPARAAPCGLPPPDGELSCTRGKKQTA